MQQATAMRGTHQHAATPVRHAATARITQQQAAAAAASGGMGLQQQAAAGRIKQQQAAAAGGCSAQQAARGSRSRGRMPRAAMAATRRGEKSSRRDLGLRCIIYLHESQIRKNLVEDG